MISPKQSYIKNLANSAILRKQFTKDFTDRYIQNKVPDDLDSTHEGKKIMSLGKFIPGKIYTYQYDPLYKDVLAFYDRRPIILVNDVYVAKGTGNHIVRGINLNFLPEKVRVATLQKFYEVFEEDIKKSEAAAEDGNIFLNLNKIIAFFKNWVSVLSVFGTSAGVGYQFAYRNYIIDRMTNLNYVEYQDWEKIPFLNPVEITGKSVAEIYKEYWATQSTLIKKK